MFPGWSSSFTTSLKFSNICAILRDQLPTLINDLDLPDEIKHNIYFMHDGCSVHFELNVRHQLNESYPNRWIGRGSNFLAWPPRSPDLTPCDYFLWGYIKSKLYTAGPAGREETWERIQQICQDMDQDMIKKATKDILKRIELCLYSNGQHFEQHL